MVEWRVLPVVLTGGIAPICAPEPPCITPYGDERCWQYSPCARHLPDMCTCVFPGLPFFRNP